MSGLPAISRSILRGKRVDARRAGITAIAFMRSRRETVFGFSFLLPASSFQFQSSAGKCRPPGIQKLHGNEGFAIPVVNFADNASLQHRLCDACTRTSLPSRFSVA